MIRYRWRWFVSKYLFPWIGLPIEDDDWYDYRLRVQHRLAIKERMLSNIAVNRKRRHVT